MENLLSETFMDLKRNGLTEDDVLFCQCNLGHFSFNHFKKISDIVYDDGYGGAEVAQDLVIVCKNGWFSRGEYDGSEWWDYHTKPEKKDKKCNPEKKDLCWNSI